MKDSHRRTPDFASNEIKKLLDQIMQKSHTVKSRAINRFKDYIKSTKPEIYDDDVDLLLFGDSTSSSSGSEIKGLLYWCGVSSSNHDNALKRICANAITLLHWLIFIDKDVLKGMCEGFDDEENIFYSRFIECPINYLKQINFSLHINNTGNSIKSALVGDRSGNANHAMDLISLLLRDYQQIEITNTDSFLDSLFATSSSTSNHNVKAKEIFKDWFSKHIPGSLKNSPACIGTSNSILSYEDHNNNNIEDVFTKKGGRPKINSKLLAFPEFAPYTTQRATRWEDIKLRKVPRQENEDVEIDSEMIAGVLLDTDEEEEKPTKEISCRDPLGLVDIDLRTLQQSINLTSRNSRSISPKGSQKSKSRSSSNDLDKEINHTTGSGHKSILTSPTDTTNSNSNTRNWSRSLSRSRSRGLSTGADNDMGFGQRDIAIDSMLHENADLDEPPSDSIMISDAHFRPDTFFKMVHDDTSFDILIGGLDSLQTKITEQGRLRGNLVREYYGLFVECADGLAHLKKSQRSSRVGSHSHKRGSVSMTAPSNQDIQLVMHSARDELRLAHESSNSLLSPILDRMDKSAKLKKIEMVMHRLAPTLEHPHKMRQAFIRGNYEEVLAIFTRFKTQMMSYGSGGMNNSLLRFKGKGKGSPVRGRQSVASVQFLTSVLIRASAVIDELRKYCVQELMRTFSIPVPGTYEVDRRIRFARLIVDCDVAQDTVGPAVEALEEAFTGHLRMFKKDVMNEEQSFLLKVRTLTKRTEGTDGYIDLEALDMNVSEGVDIGLDGDVENDSDSGTDSENENDVNEDAARDGLDEEGVMHSAVTSPADITVHGHGHEQGESSDFKRRSSSDHDPTNSLCSRLRQKSAQHLVDLLDSRLPLLHRLTVLAEEARETALGSGRSLPISMSQSPISTQGRAPSSPTRPESTGSSQALLAAEADPANFGMIPPRRLAATLLAVCNRIRHLIMGIDKSSISADISCFIDNFSFIPKTSTPLLSLDSRLNIPASESDDLRLFVMLSLPLEEPFLSHCIGDCTELLAASTDLLDPKVNMNIYSESLSVLEELTRDGESAVIARALELTAAMCARLLRRWIFQTDAEIKGNSINVDLDHHGHSDKNNGGMYSSLSLEVKNVRDITLEDVDIAVDGILGMHAHGHSDVSHMEREEYYRLMSMPYYDRGHVEVHVWVMELVRRALLRIVKGTAFRLHDPDALASELAVSLQAALVQIVAEVIAKINDGNDEENLTTNFYPSASSSIVSENTNQTSKGAGVENDDDWIDLEALDEALLRHSTLHMNDTHTAGSMHIAGCNEEMLLRCLCLLRDSILPDVEAFAAEYYSSDQWSSSDLARKLLAGSGSALSSLRRFGIDLYPDADCIMRVEQDYDQSETVDDMNMGMYEEGWVLGVETPMTVTDTTTVGSEIGKIGRSRAIFTHLLARVNDRHGAFSVLYAEVLCAEADIVQAIVKRIAGQVHECIYAAYSDTLIATNPRLLGKYHDTCDKKNDRSGLLHHNGKLSYSWRKTPAHISRILLWLGLEIGKLQRVLPECQVGPIFTAQSIDDTDIVTKEKEDDIIMRSDSDSFVQSIASSTKKKINVSPRSYPSFITGLVYSAMVDEYRQLEKALSPDHVTYTHKDHKEALQAARQHCEDEIRFLQNQVAPSIMRHGSLDDIDGDNNNSNSNDYNNNSNSSCNFNITHASCALTKDTQLLLLALQ